MSAYLGTSKIQLKTALLGPHDTQWGTITGDLSAQADLKAALDSKAESSDIPTVNNPTITITQGNAVKGSFTLNQTSAQTISLDAGGGGGGDIPADLSCNHLSVATNVQLGTGCTASGNYGAIAQGANSRATANAAVALGSQCDATQQMSYAIGYLAKAQHERSMVVALDSPATARSSHAANSIDLYVGGGASDIDAKNRIHINGFALDQLFPTGGGAKLVWSDPTYYQDGTDIYYSPDYTQIPGSPEEGIVGFQITNDVSSGSQIPVQIDYYDPNGSYQQALVQSGVGYSYYSTVFVTLPFKISYGLEVRSLTGDAIRFYPLFIVAGDMTQI